MYSQLLRHGHRLWRATTARGGGEQVTVKSELKVHKSTIDYHTPDAVFLYAYTQRTVEDSNECGGSLQTEGWIEGDPAGAQLKAGTYFAGDVMPIMSIPNETKLYKAHSKHWFIYNGWLGDYWTNIENADPTLQVEKYTPSTDDPPPSDDPPPAPGECPITDPSCGSSPLLIDWENDGYRLTSADDGVLFDLDGDGSLEKVPWTTAGSDDAWLAIDRNGNGRIDDGTELLGNHTPVYVNTPGVTAANGFLALTFMEGPEFGLSRRDGVIDSRDAIFSRLLLWRDLNHNGLSEPDELQAAGPAGLISVNTDYKTAHRRDQHGNEFLQRAKAVWSAGEFYIYDVWLRKQ